MNNKLHNRLNWWATAVLCTALVWAMPASRALEKATMPEPQPSATQMAETTNAAPDVTAESPSRAQAAATNAPSHATKHGDSARRVLRTHRDAQVAIGGNAVLPAGERAQAVVAIAGNAVAHGNVSDVVVAVLGNVEISGQVGDAVVAVLGNVKLLPGARVGGEVVSVGGRVERGEDVEIGGTVQEVHFDALNLPKVDWLKSFLLKCVLLGRPLSLGVGWVWIVAGLFLLLYLLVALALPRPVEACVEEITRRPIATLLLGLLTKVLLPIATLVLLVTGIGVFVVPFLFAAVLFAGIVGKAALLAYLGRQLGRQTGLTFLQPLLVALLAGCFMLTALYLVPFLALVVYAVTGIWALGAAVSAAFGGMRRELPQRPGLPPATPPPGYPPGTSTPPTTAAMAAPLASMPVPPVEPPGGPPAAAATPPPYQTPPVAPAVPTSPPPMHEALTLPRAGFWERMGAGFLDVILVSILGALVGGPPLGFLVALAYFAGMWTWKGTTVGGVVLNLKVVRLDGQPVTFWVALVRGLAAAFSIVVFFLGILWIAWDAEKQGWHDRIAGTVVVRTPRSQSLVCI